MITTLTKQESALLIAGPVGQIELVTALPLEKNRGAWGIVCHPHPLYGGTMNNKVVTTLTKTFQHLGLQTVRFNFRGVGRSVGQFDQGKGELEDLLAVIDWVQTGHPNRVIWLAGFSFGACIAARAAVQIKTNKLVLIAPAVEHFSLQSLPPITCPWIVVQGEKDDVVAPQAVFAWAESRQPRPLVLRFPEAGHFFHGQLGELRTRLEEVLKD